jgi:hypothetical protein
MLEGQLENFINTWRKHTVANTVDVSENSGAVFACSEALGRACDEFRAIFNDVSNTDGPLQTASDMFLQSDLKEYCIQGPLRAGMQLALKEIMPS